jgi:hypothetical protein
MQISMQISMIVDFMSDKGLKNNKQQQKFMESYLHLYKENCNLPMDSRLKAAFEYYQKHI